MGRFLSPCLVALLAISAQAAPPSPGPLIPTSRVTTSTQIKTAATGTTVSANSAVTAVLNYFEAQATALVNNAICNMDYAKPADTWKSSGAGVFLDKFIKDHGDNDWSNTIDQLNSKAPGQKSTLDCTDLLGGSCPPPETGTCMSFAPVALFHVRNAMASCYQIFTALHAHLLDNTLANSLEVDKIAKDFGENIPKESPVLQILAAAFGMVAGVGAADPLVSGPATVLSSMFSIIDTTKTTKTAIDPSASMKNQMSSMFTATEEILEGAVRAIFGGGEGAKKLSGLSSPEGEQTSIAQFFAGGKFLLQNSAQGKITDSLGGIVKDAALHMKQSLVGSALKFQNYFIWVDTGMSQSDCGGIPGSRWINNQCYSIQKINTDWKPTWGPSNVKQLDTLSTDQANNFGNNDYKIDLNDVYKNSEDCQNAHPAYDGQATPNFNTPIGSLPECFYNLPVVKAKGGPCSARGGKNPLPANLGITDGFCDKQPSGFHPPRAVQDG